MLSKHGRARAIKVNIFLTSQDILMIILCKIKHFLFKVFVCLSFNNHAVCTLKKNLYLEKVNEMRETLENVLRKKKETKYVLVVDDDYTEQMINSLDVIKAFYLFFPFLSLSFYLSLFLFLSLSLFHSFSIFSSSFLGLVNTNRNSTKWNGFSHCFKTRYNSCLLLI